MSTNMISALVAVGSFLWLGSLSAATITVSSGDTLQVIVDNAADNDTILFQTSDTFNETVTVDGKNLTFVAADGFEPEIKGPPGQSPIFVDRSTTAILRGITLTAGDLATFGDFMFEGSAYAIDRGGELVLEDSVVQGSFVDVRAGTESNPTVLHVTNTWHDPFLSADGTGDTFTEMYVMGSTLGGVRFGGTGDFQGTISIMDSTINGGVGAGGTGRAQGNISITGSTINGGANIIGTGSFQISISIIDSTLNGSVGFNGNASTQGSFSFDDSTINGVVTLSGVGSSVGELFMSRVRVNGQIFIRSFVNGTSTTTIENSVITSQPDAVSLFAGVGIAVENGELTATNVTITGHEVGLSTTESAVTSFENMLIFGNSVADIAEGTNLAVISNSLTETPVDGLTGNFGNIAGLPIVNENFNLLEGSPGIDVGNSDAVALGSLDLNGDERIQDGDNNGVSVVNLGATETVIPVAMEDDDVGNIDATNPIALNSYGTGFIATFEYEVQESDTLGGVLREWQVDVVTTGSFSISNAWISGGYNSSIQLTSSADQFTFTNQGQGYIQELVAGDVITFNVQGTGSGFDGGNLFLNFTALTQRLPATGDCVAPEPISLPFSFDGAGEFCWEVSGGAVDFINSWSTDSIQVNGESFTNVWSNSLPSSADGRLIILYNGSFAWSHFEITGTN